MPEKRDHANLSSAGRIFYYAGIMIVSAALFGVLIDADDLFVKQGFVPVYFVLLLLPVTAVTALLFYLAGRRGAFIRISGQPVCAALMLCLLGVMWLGIPPAYTAYEDGILEIVPTGGVNQAAQGKEVWITQITANNQVVDLAAHANETWKLREINEAKYLVNDGSGTEAFMLPVRRARMVTVGLNRHAWSGEARVSLGAFDQSYDLYLPEGSTEGLLYVDIQLPAQSRTLFWPYAAWLLAALLYAGYVLGALLFLQKPVRPE